MISRMVPRVRWLSVKWSLKVGAKSDALARCFAITIAIAMSKSTGVGYAFLAPEPVRRRGGRCSN